MDYDGDGRKDLLVSCPDRPYRGLYYFRNIGTAEKPLFAKAERISEKGMNNIRLSEVGGEAFVLSKIPSTLISSRRPYARKRKLKYKGEVLGATYAKSQQHVGTSTGTTTATKDIVVGIDTWDDYGWDNAFRLARSRWTRGPLCTRYVYLLENTGKGYVNRGKVEAGGALIDTYGLESPVWPISTVTAIWI